MRRAAVPMLVLVAVLGGAGCGSGTHALSATRSTAVSRIVAAVVAYEDRGGNPGEGPMFCRAGYMGGKPTGTHVHVYVWEACQQYAARHHRLVEGVGWTSPAAITAVATANGYRIVGDVQPLALYVPGYKEEFPNAAVRAQIRILDSGDSTGSISPDAMFAAVKRQATRQLLGH